MKMIKVATVLSIAAVIGLIGCSKNKGAEAIKACDDCKSDLKCIEGVAKKYTADDIKAFSTEDQIKFTTCTAVGALGGLGGAMNEAFKEMGKAMGSAGH